MILTYHYRLLPTKQQHRALEAILESQRQLYNAALEERIDAYRKANVTRTYFDQSKALTEWRQGDSEASALPVYLQRATLKRLHEAYQGFFRRVKGGGKPGFPRFRGKGWFHSFGFREFRGISFEAARLRFKGMPGALRVHLHRPIPTEAVIRSCVFRRDVKGWMVGLAAEVPTPSLREGNRAVGVDLGITTFAALSDGAVIPSLKAARHNLATLIADNEPDEALRLWRLNGDYLASQLGAAEWFAASGDYTQSIEWYRNVLSQAPDHISARIGLARQLELQGRVDDAIAELRAALAQKPDSPIILERLGDVYGRAGRKDKAKRQS